MTARQPLLDLNLPSFVTVPGTDGPAGGEGSGSHYQPGTTGCVCAEATRHFPSQGLHDAILACRRFG